MKKIFIVFLFLFAMVDCSSLFRYEDIRRYGKNVRKGDSKISVFSKFGKPTSSGSSASYKTYSWLGCNTNLIHYLPVIGFPIYYIFVPIRCSIISVTFENDRVNSTSRSHSSGFWGGI